MPQDTPAQIKIHLYRISNVPTQNTLLAKWMVISLSSPANEIFLHLALLAVCFCRPLLSPLCDLSQCRAPGSFFGICSSSWHMSSFRQLLSDEVNLLSKRILAMYSEILIYYNSWGERGATDIQSVNIRDDTKHPIMFWEHSLSSCNKLLGLKC